MWHSTEGRYIDTILIVSISAASARFVRLVRMTDSRVATRLWLSSQSISFAWRYVTFDCFTTVSSCIWFSILLDLVYFLLKIRFRAQLFNWSILCNFSLDCLDKSVFGCSPFWFNLRLWIGRLVVYSANMFKIAQYLFILTIFLFFTSFALLLDNKIWRLWTDIFDERPRHGRLHIRLIWFCFAN